MKTKKLIIYVFFLMLNINVFSIENQNLKQLIFWEGRNPFFWSVDVILNSESFIDGKNNLILYFKAEAKERHYVDDTNHEKIINSRFSRKFFEDRFKKENLEMYYFSDGIKLRNGDVLKYGRIMYTRFAYKRLRLELILKDKSNNLKVKIYEPELPEKVEKKLLELVKEVNASKQEGIYPVFPFREDVTIITENKKIHQAVNYLTNERRELYETLLNLFKNEIPKEFFEIRKFDGQIDNSGNPEKFDWKNCNDCVRVNE